MKTFLIFSYLLSSLFYVNNDWENYQKRVNEIYLNSKVDSLPISSADIIELFDIAYLHSTNYGPGVFSARAILKLEVEDLADGTTRSAFLQNEDENAIVKTFEIYPNPSNGNITIQSDEDDICSEILITDISGKIIYSYKNSNSKIEVDLAIPNGIYLIKLIFPDGRIESEKLVISK